MTRQEKDVREMMEYLEPVFLPFKRSLLTDNLKHEIKFRLEEKLRNLITIEVDLTEDPIEKGKVHIDFWMRLKRKGEGGSDEKTE